VIDYAAPSHTPPERPLPLRLLLGALVVIGWTVAGVAVIGLPAFALGWYVRPIVGYIFALAGVVILLVSARCILAVRRRRAVLLVSYLEQAVRLNLPIPPMLAAAARGESEAVARQLAVLRQQIEDGCRAGTALSVAAPAAPKRVVELLNAADRNGHLPQALRRVYRDEYRESQRDAARAGFFRAYALITVMAICFALWTIAVFVMPKLAQISRDFGTPLPRVTIHMSRAGYSLAPPLAVVAALGVVWASGRAVRNMVRTRPAPSPLDELVDRVMWHLPVVVSLARDRGMADVCHTVADALEAGRPAPEALAEAQLPHVNAVLRERVLRWAERVEQGESLAGAARGAFIPRLLVGLLATAQPEDLVNVFRFSARYYEARFSRTAVLIESASGPLIALGFGAVVCATALGIVLPMVRLIDAVAPTVEVGF
jgi:type II secretory pathway component PulF